MFYRHYSQKASIDVQGNVAVKCQPDEVSAEVALTVTDKRKMDSDAHPLGETIIGIDLGEAGIGYAVFQASRLADDIGSVEPLASGSIAIRSIRNLIKSVKHYRNRTQPRQRFQQRYNTALEQLRDNVVGDVAHAIDNLCWKYRGFPVLESSVRNLASGSNQLKLVYDRILNLYTYSSIAAHQSVREHHWHGGKNWEHPFLLQADFKHNKQGEYRDTGKFKPLSLFPGCEVYPAGTSQTCSSCLRNPIAVLQQLTSDQISLHINEAR